MKRWLWFVTIYLISLSSVALFAFTMKWLIFGKY